MTALVCFMERWINFHGEIFNLSHASRFSIEPRMDDGFYNLRVYWTWGIDKGDGGFTDSLRLCFGDYDKMNGEVMAILRGDYDVESLTPFIQVSTDRVPNEHGEGIIWIQNV